MTGFGWLFVAAGVAHFVLAVVLRVRLVTGCWAHSAVRVSRVGDAAWSLCMLSWGLAMALPPPELMPVTLIGACLASFAVLIPAGLNDRTGRPALRNTPESQTWSPSASSTSKSTCRRPG
jgi:hypothetical protein